MKNLLIIVIKGVIPVIITLHPFKEPWDLLLLLFNRWESLLSIRGNSDGLLLLMEKGKGISGIRRWDSFLLLSGRMLCGGRT